MALVDSVKSGFIAGLTLLAPLFITIVAFQLLFSWLRGIINPIVTGTGLEQVTGDLPYVDEIIALLILVAFVTVLGYFAQQRLGSIVFGLMDQGLARVPVFSVVYTGVRQVADALTSQQSRYERVAMLEYPRDGLYAIGFVTSESPVSVEDETGEETYNVYLPGSPNPTQGKFVLAPESEITELDMTVSQGIRLLVTTGIAEDRQGVAELQAEVDSHKPQDIEQALATAELDDADKTEQDGQ